MTFTEQELVQAHHKVLRRFNLNKDGSLNRAGMVRIGFMMLVIEEMKKAKEQS